MEERNMTRQEKIQAGLVFFDGGTGTMLQEAGLAPGDRFYFKGRLAVMKG